MTDEHRLSAAQIRHFDEEGYLVLRDRVPEPLLDRLRRAADRWTAGHQAGGAGVGRDPAAGGDDAGDWLYADRPSGRVLYRVDYLHGKPGTASLELLGAPEVLGIAESLAGPDFVPTYESMVLKAAGDGAPIGWHQDAVHGRRHRIFNIGVYLDPARSGEGALRVVPRSQRVRVDACGLRDEHGWHVPDAIEVPMAAGDVLVHDDMIVHGSPPAVGSRLRRTVYLEFRPAASVLEDGPWDAGWLDDRLRLVPAALAAHAAAFPAAPAWRWRVSARLRPAAAGGPLRVLHGSHTPGEWCSAGT